MDVAIEVVTNSAMHLHAGVEWSEVVVVGLRPNECRHAFYAGLCTFTEHPEVGLVQNARIAHRIRGCERVGSQELHIRGFRRTIREVDDVANDVLFFTLEHTDLHALLGVHWPELLDGLIVKPACRRDSVSGLHYVLI